MLIQPVSHHEAPVSVKNEVTRRITVITGEVHVTATFDSHPATIDRILASAGLPPPVTIGADAAAAAPASPAGPAQTSAAGQEPLEVQRAAKAQLPASVTNYQGRGFDTCAAPSESAMQAWRSRSPYRAVGIYIGGSDLACAQPNLSPSWLRDEAAAGWHFIPMYVGPQAAFGEVSGSAAHQGAKAAGDAVAQAKQLGFGPGTPLYYDMEGYKPRQTGRVLQFLSAWTTTLHAQGYSSGVYSSSNSGVADLAHQYGRGKYATPDIIFDALWNGEASPYDPVLHGKWSHHRRVRQYNGNVTQTYGGTTMQIDQDYLDVQQATGPSPSPVTATFPAGATASWYRGRAFDTCTAPSLKAITAWDKSPYRALGVYFAGRNRACGQPRLTASWVSAVSARKWRLLPIYVGLQPRCLKKNGLAQVIKAGPRKIKHSVAASEGKAAADTAAAKGEALGLRPGSVFYDYMGNYSTTCSSGVVTFVSAWTKELHRLGFLAGVYVNRSSGAQDLSRVYSSASFGRPDALWAVSGGNPSLTGWAGVSDSKWAVRQRARQYRGPHKETYGGTTIKIDSDILNAPAATVAHDYEVASRDGLNARYGPSTSHSIAKVHGPGSTLRVVCQAPGSAILGSRVWDKLTDGTYVTDSYVSTPSKIGYSAPLPQCSYPYQVTASPTLNERAGAGKSYRVAGELPHGALAWVVCQKAGSAVRKTRVWDRLQDNHWVSDNYLATPSKTTFSGPAPRC
jgi:hypothetical protein